MAQKELSGAGDNTGLRFTLDGARAQAWFSPQPGQWQRIGEALDASLLSTDTAGGFIGSTFGAYAVKR
ncbi:hypothetical protein D3C71_2017730 [compost metagenome]